MDEKSSFIFQLRSSFTLGQLERGVNKGVDPDFSIFSSKAGVCLWHSGTLMGLDVVARCCLDNVISFS